MYVVFGREPVTVVSSASLSSDTSGMLGTAII